MAIWEVAAGTAERVLADVGISVSRILVLTTDSLQAKLSDFLHPLWKDA